MKHLKSYLFVFGAALLSGSCSLENTYSNTENSVDLVTEIEAFAPAFIQQGASKTTLNRADFSVSWAAGDNIGFIPDIAGVHEGDVQRQGIFYVENAPLFRANGWGLVPGKKYYSYYPYNENSTPAEVVISYQGQNQSANDDLAHLGSYDYLHTSWTVPDVLHNEIPYNHIGCGAHLIITVPESKKYSSFASVTLDAQEELFASSAKFNPCADSPVLERTPSSSLSIGLGGNSGINMQEGTQLDVYMMMLPSEIMEKEITLTLRDIAGNKFVGKFTPALNQEAGNLYNYHISVDAVEIKPKPGFINLSEKGVSNCYIISAPGSYCFRANVKGNGVPVNGAVPELAVSKAFRAAMINNTSSDLIKDDSVPDTEEFLYYEDGFVYFVTEDSFPNGSITIALMKSDSEVYVDNMLWSWHLWFSNDDLYADTYNHTYFDGKVLMDRNLGATGYGGDGFLYQWGRKDYFPANNNTFNPYPVGLGAFTTVTRGEGIDADWTEDHLHTFVLGTDDDMHWDYGNHQNLWGHNKTMYDPCPLGYRVPDDDFNRDDIIFGAGIGNTTVNGYNWPATGMRGIGNSYNLYGAAGSYWTCSATVDNSVPGRYVGKVLDVYSLNKSGISYCISGNPVRCQKED